MHRIEIKLKDCKDLITVPLKSNYLSINGHDTYLKTFSLLLTIINDAIEKDGFLELKTGDDLHYILIKATDLAMLHIISDHE